MKKKDEQRLVKILGNWEKLQNEMTKRKITKEDVLHDEFVQWAVTTPIYNIGEHVNNLSREFIEDHQDIPWSRIAGLRHRLVHNYEGINWNIIVEVIYEDCPKLIEDIKNILSQDAVYSSSEKAMFEDLEK